MNRHRFKLAVAGSMREIIFGLEDSLVSTLGAVTGIAAGAQSTYMVILSGLVLIAVEATSMSAGSYLSSKSAAQMEQVINADAGKKSSLPKLHALRAAFVMGVCYLLGGIAPIAPYFFLPVNIAFIPSILFTVIVLFAVGAWSASMSQRSMTRGAIEMVSVSLGAAVIGFVIGRVVSATFGLGN